MRTAMRFPNALSAMRMLNPLTLLESPKTSVKKRLATVCPEVLSSKTGTIAQESQPGHESSGQEGAYQQQSMQYLPTNRVQ